LRIVTTASGTTQVIYFRFTDQGLDDNNGNVLLSPERYTAALEQLQRQQRQRLEEQLTEERKQLEEKRQADIIASSQREARAKEREAFFAAAGVSEGQLKLTGIFGGVRPIATINNLTFAVGEEQEVKVEGGKVSIRVLEIREKSVVVSVGKQPQPIELKVRDVSLKFDE